ncbi:hypothetical protein B0H16DRAFT_1406708 [Mycena metata]|uniref:F-box domain-containing protein n=1 Tax=Mycena metata TaxID=1033252 RepID=A0AAD7K4U7_9AGAR|nr:hypothetical protein B0H16DRAFT_1406708 [Mycena metata]
MCAQVALKLKGIEKKGEAANKRLGTVSTKKKSLLRQREKLHRQDAALQPPLTLELFRAAPIRRVPADVLVEIFMAMKSERIERVGNVIPVISRVCGEWRAVALDHPALWASFAFSLRETDDRVVSRLKLYLERSKTVPLTIEVDARTRPTDYYSVARAIDLMAAHSERIRGLRLKGNKWDYIGDHKRRQESEAYMPQSLMRSHRISVSEIRSLYLQRDAAYFDLPKFENLTSLTFKLLPEGWKGGWANKHAVFPKLSCWKLTFVDATPPPNKLFDYYTMPALETLEITSLSHPDGLAECIRRSECRLKCFVLRKCRVRTTDLLSIFELSPILATFKLVDGNSSAVADETFEALSVDPGRSCMLPRLTHLRIDGTYAFRDETLVQMLESRRATSLIAKLSLRDRVVEDAEINRLRALTRVHVFLACLDATTKLVTVE